jgi:integrase
MTKQEGEVLIHPDIGQPFKDLFGKDMKCIGRYTSPKSLEHCKSAISKLYSFFKSTRGEYRDGQCKACIDLKTKAAERGERLINGCEEHINDPDVRRKGNSTAERGFVSDLIKYKAYAKEHYRQKGNFQFTPGEVRACRNYLLSQNNPVCFMLYVIMLMGIKLFLRIQEVLEMKVEHFKLRYFLFDDNGTIQGMCVTVNGKTDKTWVPLQIWRDDTNPEFCLVRHLLTWIKIARIEDGGYLFPHPDDIGKTHDGSSHADYDWFLGWMKYLVFDILGKDKDELSIFHIIGTHILRKTAYLFAVFGCKLFSVKNDAHKKDVLTTDAIDRSDILAAARHNDIKCISRYVLDAGTLYAGFKRTGNLDEHRVSPWEPIHMSTHSSWDQCCTKSTRYQVPLSQLASKFAQHDLGIHPSMEVGKTGGQVLSLFIKQIMLYKPDATLQQQLVETLTTHVKDDEDRQKIFDLLEKTFQERLRAANAVGSCTKAAEPALHELGASSIHPPSPKRQKKENDMEIRKGFASATVQEKLEILKKVEERMPSEFNTLTRGARRWYERVKPMLLCFQECCNKDEAVFLMKYKKNDLAVSSFHCFRGQTHKWSSANE